MISKVCPCILPVVTRQAFHFFTMNISCQINVFQIEFWREQIKEKLTWGDQRILLTQVMILHLLSVPFVIEKMT